MTTANKISALTLLVSASASAFAACPSGQIYGRDNHGNRACIAAGTGVEQQVEDEHRESMAKAVAVKRVSTAGQSTPKSPSTNKDQLNAESVKFVTDLRTSYQHRLTFLTPRSKQIVEAFNIDCSTPGTKRYVPLANYLLARIHYVRTQFGLVLYTKVDSLGDEVRTFDRTEKKDGMVLSTEPTMEINKWGELRSLWRPPEDLRTACDGTMGPISVRP